MADKICPGIISLLIRSTAGLIREEMQTHDEYSRLRPEIRAFLKQAEDLAERLEREVERRQD
jgi:hypothetical protein